MPDGPAADYLSLMVNHDVNDPSTAVAIRSSVLRQLRQWLMLSEQNGHKPVKVVDFVSAAVTNEMKKRKLRKLRKLPGDDA